MIRLLIVDNEKHIVQGLHQLFSEVDNPELDVICAYSASEVMQWLPRVKLDIVLTDIRMPGQSGLELQMVINEQWPHCKVIFLSGYNDFEYAQTAVRNGGFDYLLKKDGDHKVIDAVKRAAAALSKELQTNQLIENAKEQFLRSMPVLQKELFLQLLEGQLSSYSSLSQRFGELGIGFRADLPVLLVLGRVDYWDECKTAKDQALLLYAVRNVAEEYLIGCRLAFVVYDRAKFVLYIQPKLQDEGRQPISEVYDKTVRFVTGMIENIQDTSKALLKLSLSFVTGHKPCAWNQIPEKFNHLKSLMTWGLGYGNEMLLSDESYGIHTENAAAQQKQQASFAHITVDALQTYMENGNKPEFFQAFDRYFEAAKEESNYYILSELYYSISLLFLSFLNRTNMSEMMAPQLDINKLMHLDTHTTWEEAVRFLHRAADLLFEKQQVKQKEQKNHMIERINSYIEAHLGDDLSLTRLAEVVYLNPSYLCRLYKQISGKGLSDHINEMKFLKAKLLLEQSSMKIHEIANAVGFESKSYFARFIRNKTNMSPQEFRDSILSKQVNEKRQM